MRICTHPSLLSMPLIMAGLLLSLSGCRKQDGWQRVFSDDFDREVLGDNWEPVQGDWRLENGSLTCLSGGLIFFAGELAGCQRIEWDIRTDAPGDLSPVIHANGSDYSSGYFLAFGGQNNRMNKAARRGEYFSFDQDHRVQAGKLHHLVAEFDGAAVRLTADGAIVHEYRETRPLLGPNHTKAGLYIYRSASIERMAIYTQPFNGTIEGDVDAPTPAIPTRAGVNLLPGGNGEDYSEFVRWGGIVTRNTSDRHSGAASIEFPTIGSGNAPGLIEIDPSKTYELSGWFKSVRADQPSRLLLDIRFHTAERKPIGSNSVHPVTGSAQLVADAVTGQTTLQVAGNDWQIKGKMLSVAFHAREDLSDLPNFDTVPVASMETNESGCIIMLAKPLTQSFPAGTGVRLHRYMDYPRVWDNNVPTEWTRYAFTIASEPAPGARAQDHFWPGAKYMSVVILHSYSKYPARLPEGEDPPVMLVDDLELRVVE